MAIRPGANQRLLSDSVSHQHGLIRFANGVAGDMASALDAGDRELLAFLVRKVRDLLRLTPLIQRQTFAALVSQVESINAAIYEGAHDAILRAMVALTRYEEQFQSGILTRASGQVVDVALTAAQREAVLTTPYVGRTIEQQMADAAAARARQIAQAIGDVVNSGGELQGVLDRIEGASDTASDGILTRSRDWLHTLAQTNTAGVADATGREVYRDSGVVRAEAWIAVLDSHTTAVCRANDGETRKLGDAAWSNGYTGPYPAHWGERSVITPLMSDEPLNKLTYAEWFAQQSSAEQEHILGPVRYRLFQAGRLPLDRFVNSKGDVLTIDQLREREADAFKRAGIESAA